MAGFSLADLNFLKDIKLPTTLLMIFLHQNWIEGKNDIEDILRLIHPHRVALLILPFEGEEIDVLKRRGLSKLSAFAVDAVILGKNEVVSLVNSPTPQRVLHKLILSQVNPEIT